MNVSQGLGNVCKVGGAKPIFSSFFSVQRHRANVNFFQSCSGGYQGRWNYFEVGGGGETSPGVPGNPYPKLKTPGFGPLFFGRDPSSLA